MGSKQDFIELSKRLNKKGGRLYLAGNITTANEEQINLQRDASLKISKQNAVFSRANSSVMFSNYYVLKANKLFDTLKRYESKLSDFNFYYGQLGYRLYSDYTTNAEYTRDEFLGALCKNVEELKNKPALSQPNEYLWKYTDSYFDMPMNNSQYLYETDTVPFLQIVLKGSVDYFAPFANQSSYSKGDVLKLIEFGAYPTFIVAAADNYELQGTPLVDYFSINFNDWYSTINEVYGSVNSALKAVEKNKISSHSVLAAGVCKTTYENGISIYVNYNSSDAEVDGVTVKALDFLVSEGGE